MSQTDSVRGGADLPEGNLGDAAISGGRWLPTAQLINQGSRIVSSLILAWFLTVEEFGLVAVATVVMSLVDRLADLGTGQAVIQRKVLDDRLADAIFALNTAIGLTLGGIIIVFAEPLTMLAGGAEAGGAVNLMRVLGLNVIIKSFGVVQFALLRRRLLFRKAATSIMASSAVYFVTTIGLAVYGAGPWSLVIGSTVGSFVAVTLTTVWSGWLPRWRFELDAIRSVARFSMGLTGTAIFNYATQNIDRSLISRELGVAALGVYALGVRVLRSPLILVTKTVNQVMVPVLSRMQDDFDGQRRHFLTASSTTAMVVFPAMLGLVVLADPLVEATLPERWAEAAPLVEIMAPIGMIRALWGLVSPLYVANARTGLQFIWSVIFGSVLIASYVVTSSISILAVVTGIGVVHLVMSPIFFTISFRIIELSFFDYLKAVGPAGLLAAAMATLVAGSRMLAENRGWSAVTQLAIGVPLGAAVFILMAVIVNPPGFSTLRRLLNTRMISKLRGAIS